MKHLNKGSGNSKQYWVTQVGALDRYAGPRPIILYLSITLSILSLLLDKEKNMLLKVRIGPVLLAGLLFVLLLLEPARAGLSLTFSKVFTPNVIGPGSISTITFTITNGSASPVTALAFSDTLPAAITIADPANASTTCDLGLSGSLTAPDGGSTITLSDAQIGGSQSCTVTVDVTASTPGAHTNPAITLSSSAGSEMSLPIDLNRYHQPAGL